MPNLRLNPGGVFAISSIILMMRPFNRVHMYRVLTAFFLVILIVSESSGQQIQPLPVLRNGKLGNAMSLIHHKFSQTAWQPCRFGDTYFFVLQLNRIADPVQKTTLARHGILLGTLAVRLYLPGYQQYRGLNLEKSGGTGN